MNGIDARNIVESKPEEWPPPPIPVLSLDDVFVIALRGRGALDDARKDLADGLFDGVRHKCLGRQKDGPGLHFEKPGFDARENTGRHRRGR